MACVYLLKGRDAHMCSSHLMWCMSLACEMQLIARAYIGTLAMSEAGSGSDVVSMKAGQTRMVCACVYAHACMCVC